MCVASAFTIATGKHIGDRDPVPSTSASCTPALEAGDPGSFYFSSSYEQVLVPCSSRTRPPPIWKVSEQGSLHMVEEHVGCCSMTRAV